MPTTLSLLDRALTVKSMPEWAETLHVHRNALRNARQAGHLTPVIAGNLAIELNEDPEPWMALAVIEGEKDSPAKQHLARRLANRLSAHVRS